jgi:hypothetical protein
MDEEKQDPAPAEKILYSEKQLKNFEGRYSLLKPIQPGDLCCNCGRDCDGEGFALMNWRAYRVRSHPICARGSCTGARWDEFNGRRSACRCGVRKKA